MCTLSHREHCTVPCGFVLCGFDIREIRKFKKEKSSNHPLPVVHYIRTDQNNRKAWLSMEELEQIMRRIHVLFAKCEPYGDERDGRIIVPKKEMFRLLEKLNYAVIRMMDEYEGTVESRERGISAYQREGERIRTAAQAGADDVYAASLIYVDNMLEELTDVVAGAKEELWEQYARMAGRLDERARSLAEDQEEIKQLLTAMAQGGKYLKIIEHENKRLQEAEMARQESDIYGEDTEEYWDEYEDEPYGDDEKDEDGDAGGDGSGTQDLEDVHAVRTGVPGNGNGEDGDGTDRTLDTGRELEGEPEPSPGNAGFVSGNGEVPAPEISGLPSMTGENDVPSGSAGDMSGNARRAQDTEPGNAVPEQGGESGSPGRSGEKHPKPSQPAGGQSPKHSYRRRLPASKHARMVPDLEAEWAKEEQRPVRKIGTAIYEDVGQPYDAPVKRVTYEVKVNQAYFDQLGEGNIDLDAEYYQWKEEQEQAAAALEEPGGGEDRPADEVPENRGKSAKNKKGKKKRGLKFGKRG